MATTDLSQLSDEQLVHRELGLERTLLAANFRHRMGQLDDTSTLAQIRKDIARARTAQRTRELESGVRKDSLRNQFRATFVPVAADAAVEGEATGGFLEGLKGKLGIGDDSE